MAIDIFEHTFVVEAPAEVVYRHLVDPNSYVGLSPLVVEVRDIRLGQDDSGRSIIEYVAVERFRAGRFVRWNNEIHVVITQTDPGRTLISDVASPGRVRSQATVDLTEEDDGTRVTEKIEVESPAPLRRFVAERARSLQLNRATELTRRMARIR